MTKPSARDDILRKALECFLRFGYERTAMQDIAVAAGLSRQGLYHHFANKEELFEALNEASNGWTLRAAEEACARARAEGLPFAGVVGATLYARLGSMFIRLGSSAEHLEFIDQSLRRCGPVIERYAGLFHQLMTRIVDDEIAAGGLTLANDVTADELAESLAAIARGINARMPSPKADMLLGRYTRGAELVLRGASSVR
jgi:AcrR family transcriptional regulator